MFKFFAMLIIALNVTGCQWLTNYHFGDVTRSAIATASEVTVMRYRYCTETNPIVRESILEAIHIMVPKYPKEGICTDLRGLIKEIKGLEAEPTVE